MLFYTCPHNYSKHYLDLTDPDLHLVEHQNGEVKKRRHAENFSKSGSCTENIIMQRECSKDILRPENQMRLIQVRIAYVGTH